MTNLQRRAIQDAEADHAAALVSDKEWIAHVTAVRLGEVRSPFEQKLAIRGPADMCTSLEVDLNDWDAHVADWKRDYNGYYLAAIEVLARPSVEPRA